MIKRIRYMLACRKLRKTLGVPMNHWWECVALPYIITGKMPKLGPEWKIWEGPDS